MEGCLGMRKEETGWRAKREEVQLSMRQGKTRRRDEVRCTWRVGWAQLAGIGARAATAASGVHCAAVDIPARDGAQRTFVPQRM